MFQINLPNSSKDTSKKVTLSQDHIDSTPSNETLVESEKENNKSVIPFQTGTSSVQTSVSAGRETEKAKRRENKAQNSNNLNNVKVPQFYYPYGKPVINSNRDEHLQKALQEIGKLEDGKAYKQHMKSITKVRVV